MQEFAPSKTIIKEMGLHQLICFSRKYRMAVRIMKLTAIILSATCLQVSAIGISQTITLSLKDAPLTKVFKEIERQTDYTFFYSWDRLDKAKRVTVSVKNLPIDQVLDLCFRGQPFTYSISGKTITIAAKKVKTVEEGKTIINEAPLTNVKGRVVNSKGEPVSDATITVQGTNQRTITNANGEFSLVGIDEDAIIIISHVQYETESLSLNGHNIINATLQIKINSMDELQVIAYGTTSKRLNTGNVSTVKSADIEKQPVDNPLLALEGRVPGLFVTQSTGLPGTGVTVRIQGVNSISRGNDPLYVIDGVPYTSLLLRSVTSILGLSGTQGSSGNPLTFINPSDIESIEVLKDADATAIYGSRAANGAVLITTKKGKSGQAKVDINFQTGWGKVTNKLDLLNTEQYLQMRNEARRNDNLGITATQYDINGIWDSTRYTDWQKTLIGGTANYSDVSASVSGGNIGTQYLFGGTYRRETTVFPGDFSDQKASVHFNVNSLSANQKFRAQLTGSYLIDNNRLLSDDLTYYAVSTAPDAPPLYNMDGTLNWAPRSDGVSTWTNPLSYQFNRYKNKTDNLIGNAIVSYKVFPELDILTSLGYTNLQSNETLTVPLLSSRPEDRPNTSRSAVYGNSNINSWIIEPQANYKTFFGKSKLEVLIGTTFHKINSSRQQLLGVGYNSDLVLEDIKAASTVNVNSTVNSIYKYSAVFGRFKYNWDDKYVADFTGRRDGSSRFGEKNRFHNFGAIGIGWVFSNEKFVSNKIHFISFGKLRGSYGTTGNDQIGDYQFLNLYSPPSGVGVTYQGMTGLQPNGLTNPYLSWEETKKLQVGMELGLFKDRILLNINYFHNRSSNQLLPYALPIITGFSSITSNFPATVLNSGWEFACNTVNLRAKGFNWTSDINFTLPKNKLVAFSNLATSALSSLLIVGQPITIREVYHLLNVNPATGVFQFEDFLGNPTSKPQSATDRTVVINTSPQFYGGIQNSFTYKAFQLDFLFQFVKQIGPNYFFGNYPGGKNSNQPVTVLSRWKKPGDITIVQRYNSDYSVGQFDAATQSDAAYSDASYIRLKNISFSWLLPKRWLGKAHIQDGRLFIQGQNLFTITKYIGLDPETMSSTTLPPLRVLTCGLKVGL